MSKKLAASTTQKKPGRIDSLDLLKGYFMVSIILNHLQWYPSGLDWVAARGSLLISAAEGFFLVSGILLGIVRGRGLLSAPFKVPALLMLSRGMKLYIIGIILMLAFTFIGWLFTGNPGLKPGIRPIDQPITDIIFGALTFQYIYGWADFLRLYAIFLIMSPLALWLLRKNKWFVVLLASVGLWALFPFALESTGRSAELLMPLSWQLIFFIGLIFGFYWNTIKEWWGRLSLKLRRSILIPILSIAGITLTINIVISALITFGIAPFPSSVYDSLAITTFNKEALTLPRIALFFLWFSLGLFIVTRFETRIKKWFGWILLPFGTNLLYVYILHAIILFFVHLVLPPEATTNIFVNFIGSILVLGVLLLAVKKRFLFKIIPR